jgi:exodeoxyribonuclease V gamma subunit
MLNVYRSNRMERLVDALAEVLREPPAEPAAPEWIAVQSQGMRAWLAQQLADRFGVFANVRMPFPRGLIDSVFDWVLGDGVPESEPFEQSGLAWAVLGELQSVIDRPGFEPVRAFLRDDRRGFKRHQLARAIARTFDEYALYRPEMVLAWERDPRVGDWQAELWRATIDRIRLGGHAAHVGRTALDAIAALDSARPIDPGAPGRVSLFGVTALPPLYVRVLGSFAEQREVDLFLLSPSRHYWADISARVPRGVELGSIEELHLDPGHPLLASLGRLGRDFQSVLESAVDYGDPGPDLYLDPAVADPSSLLAALQSDMLELRAPGADHPGPVIAEDDPSLRIHSCHGPLREVEVLRDQLLGLLDDRELDLRLEDILVATPDIECFAPLVDAVFGRRIPHTISGRIARRESPVIDGLLALLEMIGGRAEASVVLDFMSRAPVLARAGLSASDLELATRWTIEAGARWGVDETHRDRLDQPALRENTWGFALDRLLLGYAVPGRDRELFQGVLPFDDVEGSAAEVLGRYAAHLELTLSRIVELERPRPVAAFAGELRRALTELFDDRGPLAEQHAAVHSALARIEASARRAGFDDPVDASVVRVELEALFDDGASGGPLAGGGVRVAGLLPLRGIPFRVVCLLGMGEGALPRSVRAPGFDEMAAHPLPGDRSPRDDDRAQFLEALLSARERLIVTYTGQDPHTNEPLPPSVLVSDLLDTIEQVYDVPADRLTVRHPLQPFSRRYFETGPARDPRLFSYRGEHLRDADAAGHRKELPPFVDPDLRLPLDAKETGSVRLVDLERFFKAPVAYFLGRRLGLIFDEDDRAIDDREPFELSGLAHYHAGDRLLDEVLAGGDARAHYPVLRAAGVLPLGAVGRAAFEDLAAWVDLFREELAEVSGAGIDPVEVALDVTTRFGETRVVGVLDGLTESARLRVSFGRKYAYRLLQLWIGHLALGCVARPGYPGKTIWIGRSKDGVERVVLEPVKGDAQALLADLVDLYLAGQEAPLPLFPASSLEFAYKVTSPHRKKKETPAGVERQALKNAWGKWNPDAFRGVREGADPAVARVYGRANPLAGEAADGELGFKKVALRAFGPMLAHLERFTMGSCR